MVKELRIYRTQNGKAPFRVWMDKLRDKVAKARIEAKLNNLVIGHYGDCKSIGKRVYELRIHMSSGYRVYFAEYGQSIVLLLLGGNKRTQQQDIEKAKTYWQEFEERINYD